MTEQQNERVATGRTEINDIPQPERELTDEESRDVQGGAHPGGVNTSVITSAGPGGGPHVKISNPADVNKKFGDGSV